MLSPQRCIGSVYMSFTIGGYSTINNLIQIVTLSHCNNKINGKPFRLIHFYLHFSFNVEFVFCLMFLRKMSHTKRRFFLVTKKYNKYKKKSKHLRYNRKIDENKYFVGKSQIIFVSYICTYIGNVCNDKKSPEFRYVAYIVQVICMYD